MNEAPHNLFEVVPLTKHIGAEIRGVDLSKPVDSQTIKAIYQTWIDHLVIIFRGQNLTQEDHMRATQMFGEVGHIRRPPKYFPAGFDRVLPGIMFISNIRENGEPIGALPVGKNLQDHLAAMIMFTRPNNPSPFRDTLRADRIIWAMVQAYFFGKGAGTVVPGGLHAFIKSNPGLDVPDIEFMFRGLPASAGMWFPGIKKAYADGFGIRPCLLHPESRGQVLLRSSDPADAPRIVYNFFSSPNDLPRLREGFKIARDVAHQKAMDPFRGEETANTAKAKTDAEIEAYLKRAAITAHHPAGTCKMGTDNQSVLDTQLRVRGVEGLRVVDASAMPDMVGAHINACVIMMADKASDIIRGRDPLAAVNV